MHNQRVAPPADSSAPAARQEASCQGRGVEAKVEEDSGCRCNRGSGGVPRGGGGEEAEERTAEEPEAVATAC